MSIVELFLTLQNQLRVFHWQTKSFSQHQAFGGAYEDLDDLVDNFMEVYIGRYQRPVAKNKFEISLSNYEPESHVEFIDIFIEVLENQLPEALTEKDTDLLNIRDEMLAVLHKLKYLLTLN